MNNKFEIKSGSLFNPDGKKIAIGYAGGNCGKNPEGINNPAFIKVKSVGPLPPGRYTFGTPVQHSHLGPFAIPLIPAASNEMFGRSGFFIHGDTTPAGRASEGCIIVPRSVRDALWAGQNHTLDVEVAA